MDPELNQLFEKNSEPPKPPQTPPTSNQGFGQFSGNQNFGQIKEDELKPLRTYEGDVAEFMKSHGTSSVSIATAESQRRASTPIERVVEREPKSYTTLIVTIISLVFVVAGITAVFFAVNSVKPPATVTVEEIKTLIPTESKKNIDLNLIDTARLKIILQNEITNSKIPLGSFLGFYFTQTTASTGKQLLAASQFLKLLVKNIPDSLLRTMSADFLFGLVSYDGNRPFLLLKVDSFQQAYGGMLEWEKDLAYDFSDLLAYPNDTVIATTTPTTNALLFNDQLFSDTVIKNKDVRILRTQTGRTRILYSILDKSTILITPSENAFSKVLERLSTASLVR